ncbi:MAG: TonB family protein [Bacteroidales bacterium]|nr:TonB family protein [Bacteroidales bacterium]
MKKIALTIALALAVVMTSAAQDFSANLKRHIDYLSSTELQGRKAGSEGEAKAAAYLYDKLSQAGLTMLTGREGDSFLIVEDGDTLRSCNVAGILQGYDNDLREEYIVVGAHIDHLGTYDVTVDGEQMTGVYRGADANASGVAALIEAANILGSNAMFLRRSVLFVGFGAGEEEYAGARFFASGGEFSDTSNIKLMVNLDMLGRGNTDNPFEIYSMLGRNDLASMTSYVTENESVTTRPGIHNGEIFPSDHLAFEYADIPTLTFSTGRSREYRTPRDVPELILYNKLAAETHYIATFLKCLAYKDHLFPSATVSEPESGDFAYSMSDCDRQPQFFHSDLKHFMNAWVYSYVKYPQSAVDKGIQGTVNVSFIIEKDGSVTNVKVEKGVDEILDEEAVKVISASPKWSAGEIGRKKVRCKITVPVEFRLQKGSRFDIRR